MLLSNELLFISAEKSALAEASGAFGRKVAILAREEAAAEANRAFLAKVLTAVNLQLEQDALFATAPLGVPLHIAADLREKQPQVVLVFGISPAQIGLSIQVQAYQPFAFYGVQWLFADALSVLEPDVAKKKLLWAALKSIFLETPAPNLP